MYIIFRTQKLDATAKNRVIIQRNAQYESGKDIYLSL